MKKAIEMRPVVTRIAVSEKALQKAAARLLTHASRLVSTEIQYLQRILGTNSTQLLIDEKVVAVRSMPWKTFAPAD